MRESPWRETTVAGFTIFEAVLVILIIFVVVATLIPKVGQTLGHARVNRSANVVAAEFLLAQSLAARQHAPVILAVNSATLTVTISQPPPSNTVLRSYVFDITSDFKLGALSANPSSVQVMPNGTANASMLITVGGSDYYHLVRLTQAGQVRITQ
ncbi:MAG TPA: type II secretion system protein [Gemmatimonadales bacterium]|nr:type II secretion system protein [Gemmatimonadales bacterium]